MYPHYISYTLPIVEMLHLFHSFDGLIIPDFPLSNLSCINGLKQAQFKEKLGEIFNNTNQGEHIFPIILFGSSMNIVLELIGSDAITIKSCINCIGYIAQLNLQKQFHDNKLFERIKQDYVIHFQEIGVQINLDYLILFDKYVEKKLSSSNFSLEVSALIKTPDHGNDNFIAIINSNIYPIYGFAFNLFTLNIYSPANLLGISQISTEISQLFSINLMQICKAAKINRMNDKSIMKNDLYDLQIVYDNIYQWIYVLSNSI